MDEYLIGFIILCVAMAIAVAAVWLIVGPKTALIGTWKVDLS
jgi:hypothetical protein